MSLAMLAIISGLLQALGYFIYIRKSLRHELEPNPTTWFMFAYGTTALTVLEWDREASWYILVLPVVCASLSLVVAFLCWKRNKLVWPSHWMDRSAFLTDVLLTLTYIGVWYLTIHNVISEDRKDLFALGFLVLTNLSTAISFVPLIKGTISDPRSEHPLPWFVWAGAYATLAYVTHLESGWSSEFMIYPVLNTVLHGSVALFAIRRWWHRPNAPLTDT